MKRLERRLASYVKDMETSYKELEPVDLPDWEDHAFLAKLKAECDMMHALTAGLPHLDKFSDFAIRMELKLEELERSWSEE